MTEVSSAAKLQSAAFDVLKHDRARQIAPIAATILAGILASQNDTSLVSDTEVETAVSAAVLLIRASERAAFDMAGEDKHLR